MDKKIMQKGNFKVKKSKAKKHGQLKVHKYFTSFKRKRKSGYDAEEEARLEKIVFGETSDIINNISNDETTTKVIDESLDTHHGKLINVKKNKSDQNDSNLNDSIYINSTIKEAAWVDDDDCNYTVDKTLQKIQNRKLSCQRLEKSYATYLENRYKMFVGTPKWAKLEKNNEIETDDLDKDILKHSCHLEVPEVKNLPKDLIDIKALKALNKSTHTEGPIITSAEFHPLATVALVAGTSGVLSLFQVDGHTNDKLHSMQFKKYPITKAIFMKEGTQILLSSQYYTYYYTYDLMNGKTYKLHLPHGITNMKHYEISPDGKLIALCGKTGEIYLLHSSTKELITTFKMNVKCTTLAFTSDSKILITHGDGNEMYVWDLNTRRCINRAVDNGCLSCTSLAVSSSGQFVATGSMQGVVNLYNTKAVLEEQSPTPLKTMMNLVTSITSLKFNPISEILCAASIDHHNAFRMLHIPSFTVFSNFPTLQTNIGIPQTISFSPNSGYLSISNRTGSALLWRLRHYGKY